MVDSAAYLGLNGMYLLYERACNGNAPDRASMQASTGKFRDHHSGRAPIQCLFTERLLVPSFDFLNAA
jgi:hypothetical protein